MAENQNRVARTGNGQNVKRNQKAKAKKFVKAAKAVGAKTVIPAFLYVSKCCGALGKKAPVVKRGQDEQKKFPQNLGHFRCSECNRPASMNRTLNTEGVEVGIS